MPKYACEGFQFIQISSAVICVNLVTNTSGRDMEGPLSVNVGTVYIETNFFVNCLFTCSIFRQSLVRSFDFSSIVKLLRRRPPRKSRQKLGKRSVAQNLANESSGHDDQFCPKIIKIGAILGYFGPPQSLQQKTSKKPGFYVLIGPKTRFLCTNRSENPVSMY